MAVTWAQVVEIASELSTVPVATQTVILAIVDRQIDDDIWLDFADDGRRYLAAHIGSLYSSGSASAGSITSETLGPMSRSYGSVSDSGGGDELATTKYGLFYLHLIGLLPPTLGFVA